jgi:hypothetical protein
MEASLERISVFSTTQNNKPGCRITTRELVDGFETALYTVLTVRNQSSHTDHNRESMKYYEINILLTFCDPVFFSVFIVRKDPDFISLTHLVTRVTSESFDQSEARNKTTKRKTDF